MSSDFAIVGGGIVGLSVAWGLLKRGLGVTVLDGADDALRASRGNFGLVWVQGKGLKQPVYARWSQTAAAAWSDFAEELEDATGFDLSLEQHGGLDLHFSENSLADWAARYTKIQSILHGDYPFEVLSAKELRKEEPGIGDAVVGALLHHQDGQVNPLRLLRALAEEVRRLGGEILSGKQVLSVTHGAVFDLGCSDGSRIEADRVVLAAGLGAAELGPKFGFKAPLSPERGQVLITEKLAPLIRRPSLIARQVNEGAVQIGATNELVGQNDAVTRKGMAQLAAEAVAAYPDLARAQLVRSWGALRVMSPDGLPIYQESEQMPGAFLVTCHSGVTLAAAHARRLPEWLLKGEGAPDLEVFGEARFAI
ncbi:NAD(P)/FAD-dependent oxidoreductase [Shimia abyssi]|uniref:Glycine/D-amino acid oxidase-like deaminating enzyme n=1 Tax=Shimia abyssi TaxID=1662395 RepID=A0A2P8FHL1_9RHOB|nr:FAD-dependent oxidoreductase [Shimia abyssi]PSL21234.1 glycine/D-amino acid oxidase-like deaminating enzyme [Shimia abyssi]